MASGTFAASLILAETPFLLNQMPFETSLKPMALSENLWVD